jgi:capsular polysaccharide biosynthesis protein
VEKLFFPSILSPTHDYYGKSPRADDFLIAPEAVMLLREALLPHVLKDNVDLCWDYIYVARSGGSHRAVTNEADVISLVESMGFKVVYPGKLSFVEQITLFSNAKIVIGPTGAGMANIIFAKKECKIAVLAAATKNANYYLFAQLSQYIGQVITYVCGKPVDSYQIHSDYQIDVCVLRNLIIEYIAEINVVNIDARLQRKI